MHSYAMTVLTETYLSMNLDDYLIFCFCSLQNESEQEQAGKIRFSLIY